ncbi:MAG: fused MFS/spermidine synthase [Chloroflexota bacterium]|nr:fused MFS/spermidine synthase [Chloroflexota bacterium]
MKRFPLLLIVFFAGLVTLGVELAASRLLAPFFGTSLLVWATLIGLILIYLSVGYWLGGRWADRSPRMQTLIGIITVAAILVGLVPIVAAPVLRLSVEGFARLNAGLLGGSFAGVLLLFTAPMILLGCVSPFAIRLAVDEVEHAGRVAGQIYALSTLGSFVGTFLPVLWLIPSYGTRWTFWLFALLLLTVAALAAAMSARRALAWPVLGFATVLALALWTQGQAIKPGGNVLYEGESLYHYIRVVEEDGWRLLELNEGQGTHSAYYPGSETTGGVWDFYLLAPLFNPAPYDPFAQEKRWAIIGVAAGTTPRAIQAVYGDEPVVGVEIDGQVVEVGHRFFAMEELTSLEVIIEDGRTWLAHDSGRYHVIAVDAYRQPYIPFHLTTVEFFTDARAHLTSDGVVAINVGRAPGDWQLVDALYSTMQEVFPNVYAIDMDDSYNTLLIGTNQAVHPDDVVDNIAAISDPTLLSLIERARGHIRIPVGNDLIFTDDRAPVEQVIDSMITRFALAEGLEQLR